LGSGKELGKYVPVQKAITERVLFAKAPIKYKKYVLSHEKE
jgi:hypothetical protein